MTRRCAVFGCDNSDYETTETLYRFPEDKAAAMAWKESLQLREFPVELLQTRFGVCNLHFKNSDFYQTDEETENVRLLKANAIPTLTNDENSEHLLGTSLGISVEGTNETVRIMAPTNANIALLQPPSTSKPYRTRSMEFSTASTGGNTDISILRTHDSHYGDDEEEDDDHFDDIEERNRFTAERLQQSIDAPDFTVVSCALDDSSDNLRFHAIKPPESHNGYSGTDSDIEVLMSEEVNDTEWSAALENLENNALEFGGKHDDCSVEAVLTQSMEEQLGPSTSPRRQESTEHDCSIEEFSRQSPFDGVGLNRDQLIDIVREQRVRIRELEMTLTRYRDAQNALFEHVEALRLEFAPCSTSANMDKTHMTLD